MRPRNKIRIAVCVAFVLLGAEVGMAQTKNRLIPFPDWSLDNTDDELSLELLEIKIAGKPIALDTPFDADDNWLKDMTLRVKNIGTKPIVAFGVGGGLLHGVWEELPMYASYQYGIAWNWGTNFNPEKEKPKGPGLKPGETVELTYANVNSLHRHTLSKDGEGTFCKLEFVAPAVEYIDGTAPSFLNMRFPRPR